MLLGTGSIVRIYYDEDVFDEGRVQAIDNEFVCVDFYDWIERWPINKFVREDLYFEATSVFIPVEEGEIVLDFYLANREKLIVHTESL